MLIIILNHGCGLVIMAFETCRFGSIQTKKVNISDIGRLFGLSSLSESIGFSRMACHALCEVK